MERVATRCEWPRAAEPKFLEGDPPAGGLVPFNTRRAVDIHHSLRYTLLGQLESLMQSVASTLATQYPETLGEFTFDDIREQELHQTWRWVKHRWRTRATVGGEPNVYGAPRLRRSVPHPNSGLDKTVYAWNLKNGFMIYCRQVFKRAVLQVGVWLYF